MDVYLVLFMLLDCDSFAIRERSEHMLYKSWPFSANIVEMTAEGMYTVKPEQVMRCQRIRQRWDNFVGPRLP